MEAEGIAGRDRRGDVPGIEIGVVGLGTAAGLGPGSRMGDAIALGSRQYGAVSVFAEFGRGGHDNLGAEAVFFEDGERRAAGLTGRRGTGRNLVTRKKEWEGT